VEHHRRHRTLYCSRRLEGFYTEKSGRQKVIFIFYFFSSLARIVWVVLLRLVRIGFICLYVLKQIYWIGLIWWDHDLLVLIERRWLELCSSLVIARKKSEGSVTVRHLVWRGSSLSGKLLEKRKGVSTLKHPKRIKRS